MLYDDIGRHYDATRRADPTIADRLAHHLDAIDGGMYLDVACGTGNYTAALATRSGRWYGIDQSRRMLHSAGRKSDLVAWCQGDVAAQPFRGAVFSGAICTLALHHFGALASVFSEVYRVITAGPFVVFTATPEQTRGYWLNEYFPEAMERSIAGMPPLDRVQDALSEAGFQLSCTEPYEVQPDLQDLFLYSGKHRPEIYLSESVRRGISTFSVLADPSEISAGCAQLRADIASGRIAAVMDGYRHGNGDYLFVVARKRR